MKKYLTKEEKRDKIFDAFYWLAEKLEKQYKAEIKYNIDDIFIYTKDEKKKAKK